MNLRKILIINQKKNQKIVAALLNSLNSQNLPKIFQLLMRESAIFLIIKSIRNFFRFCIIAWNIGINLKYAAFKGGGGKEKNI